MTGEECKKKYDALKVTYRKLRGTAEGAGAGGITWTYCTQMEQLEDANNVTIKQGCRKLTLSTRMTP